MVIDIGSGTIKAGYAGEDTPKACFPSVYHPLCSSDAIAHQNPLVGLHAARLTHESVETHFTSIRCVQTPT